MALEEIFVSLGELFSSILHLLPLFFYPCGSGSTTLVETVVTFTRLSLCTTTGTYLIPIEGFTLKPL